MGLKIRFCVKSHTVNTFSHFRYIMYNLQKGQIRLKCCLPVFWFETWKKIGKNLNIVLGDWRTPCGIQKWTLICRKSEEPVLGTWFVKTLSLLLLLIFPVNTLALYILSSYLLLNKTMTKNFPTSSLILFWENGMDEFFEFWACVSKRKYTRQKRKIKGQTIYNMNHSHLWIHRDLWTACQSRGIFCKYSS